MTPILSDRTRAMLTSEFYHPSPLGLKQAFDALEEDLQVAHHRTSGWALNQADKVCQTRNHNRAEDQCCDAFWPWFYDVVLRSPEGLITGPVQRQLLYRNHKIDYCPFCGSRVTK